MGLREGMVYGVGSMKEKASQGQHGRGQPRGEGFGWCLRNCFSGSLPFPERLKKA